MAEAETIFGHIGGPNTQQKAALAQQPGSNFLTGAGYGDPVALLGEMRQNTIGNTQAIQNATTQAQQRLQSAANLAQGGAQQTLANAYNTAGYQAGQGAAGLNQGQQLADYNTQLGQAAVQNFGGLGQQAQEASGYYGQQGAEQYQNSQQARNAQLGAIANLQSFYQQGPGESAAQAQLQQGQQQAQANAMALANSGRGAGENAQSLREAMFANAATQQNTNQQAAQLRAQEAANWRGQQLGAMGAEQQGLQGVRGQDINNMGAAAGLGSQYAQLGADYYKSGVTAQQNSNQLANQALGTGEQYNQGMTQAANTATGQGLDSYGHLIQNANSMTAANAGTGLQGTAAQVASNEFGQGAETGLMQFNAGQLLQKYGIDKNIALQVGQQVAQQNAATTGAIATLGGGLLTLSDMREKKNIKPVIELFRKPAASPLALMTQIAQLKAA